MYIEDNAGEKIVWAQDTCVYHLSVMIISKLP